MFVFWCEGHKRWYPPLSRSDTWYAYLIGFFLQYQNTTLHILYPGDNCSSNPHINPYLRSLLLLPWAREVKCVQWVAMGWTEFNFWRRYFPFCYHIHTSSCIYADSYAMWKTYVSPTNAHSIIYVLLSFTQLLHVLALSSCHLLLAPRRWQDFNAETCMSYVNDSRHKWLNSAFVSIT
jgi:hypothetical protein